MFVPAIKKYLEEKVVYVVSKEIWYHSEVKKWCDTKEEAIAEWERLTGFEYSETAYRTYLQSIDHHANYYEYFAIGTVSIGSVIDQEIEYIKKHTIYEESEKIEARVENSIRQEAEKKVKKEFEAILREAFNGFF